ncbi:MAG TPA: hypothetical protein VGB56_11810 [Flavisolibacter sp.]
MRKLILSLALLTSGTVLLAQDFKAVKESLDKGKIAEARERIDKEIADPKNQKSANAWYYKGLVYSELSKDSTKTDMDYRMEAFNAFKKYQELDPKNIMLMLNQNANFFQLYEAYYNQGVKDFNAQAYDKAFQNFVGGLQVKDYVYTKGYEINGFKFPALDTQLLNLTGSAGIMAKKEDQAMPYYQMLADAKLKGEDFKQIYPILVEYYGKKGDSVNQAKYLAIGSELYPENPYWNQSKIAAAGTDRSKRMAQFKELLKNDPKNADLLIDYAVELFNYTYGKDKPANYTESQQELTTSLQNAITVNPSSVYANYIMTQHLSNQMYDLQQDRNAIKGTKPEDIKKKQAMDKEIMKKAEEMFVYSEAAYNMYDKMPAADMKASDKANFKTVTNQVIDYYVMKKQPEKAKIYEDTLKTIK